MQGILKDDNSGLPTILRRTGEHGENIRNVVETTKKGCGLIIPDNHGM